VGEDRVEEHGPVPLPPGGDRLEPGVVVVQLPDKLEIALVALGRRGRERLARRELDEGHAGGPQDRPTSVVGEPPEVRQEEAAVSWRRARQVEVPWTDKAAQERALHRLVLLDVVRDYLVEWGSKRFVVWVNPTTPESVQRALLDFVERSQPGRLDSIAAGLQASYPKLEAAIEDCGRALITFVYDTIERSRRRSMREMYLVAATATSDGESAGGCSTTSARATSHPCSSGSSTLAASRSTRGWRRSGRSPRRATPASGGARRDG